MEKYNVKNSEFCVCTNCERVEDMGLECLTNNLLNSPEGRHLVKEQRWGNFQWEDRDRFEQFIGPDANNFWHGPHQAREVAIPFIEYQNVYGQREISQADARLLVAINCIHDIQEAVFGDTPLPDKTAETDAEELFVQGRIVSRILGLPFTHPYVKRMAEVQGGVNFLSRAFKAMEYAGYFNTGVRAWSLKDHEGLEDDERHRSYELGHAVLTRNVPRMRAMREFPYIQMLLLTNSRAIAEAEGTLS